MNCVTGVLIVSLVVNIFLSLFKIIMGIIFLSSSLIADGMHSFSDLITDIVGIIGAVFSKKPPDNNIKYYDYFLFFKKRGSCS